MEKSNPTIIDHTGFIVKLEKLQNDSSQPNFYLLVLFCLHGTGEKMKNTNFALLLENISPEGLLLTLGLLLMGISFGSHAFYKEKSGT